MPIGFAKRVAQSELPREGKIPLIIWLPIATALTTLIIIYNIKSQTDKERTDEANAIINALAGRVSQSSPSCGEDELAKCEAQLTACLHNRYATNTERARAALLRVSQLRAAVIMEKVFDESRTALDKGAVAEATAGLTRYITSPSPSREVEAQALLAEIRNAQSEQSAIAALVTMPDLELAHFENTKSCRNPHVKHPTLIAMWNNTLLKAFPEASRPPRLTCGLGLDPYS